VAHVGELGLPPSGLAVKTAVGVGRTGMGVILALLPVEVCAAVFVAAAVLGFRRLVMNFVNMSPFCSRSRFFVKVVGSQT